LQFLFCPTKPQTCLIYSPGILKNIYRLI